jgi:hypothetical protein
MSVIFVLVRTGWSTTGRPPVYIPRLAFYLLDNFCKSNPSRQRLFHMVLHRGSLLTWHSTPFKLTSFTTKFKVRHFGFSMNTPIIEAYLLLLLVVLFLLSLVFISIILAPMSVVSLCLSRADWNYPVVLRCTFHLHSICSRQLLQNNPSGQRLSHMVLHRGSADDLALLPGSLHYNERFKKSSDTGFLRDEYTHHNSVLAHFFWSFSFLFLSRVAKSFLAPISVISLCACQETRRKHYPVVLRCTFASLHSIYSRQLLQNNPSGQRLFHMVPTPPRDQLLTSIDLSPFITTKFKG